MARMKASLGRTRAEKREELRKCKKDPAYFIRRYCKIRHPKKGLIPFTLYDFQEDLLTDYENNRFNVVLKARQLGISTVSAAYSVWLMLFRKYQSIVIMATRLDVAQNLMDKIKLAYKELPEDLKIVGVKSDNRTEMIMENGSFVKCIATSRDGIRSESLSLLIFDEAGFIEDMDGIWVAAQPALSYGGSCIVLSTPNGAEGLFYDTCVGAEEKTNDFHLITLPWHVHPDRDQAWFDEQTRALPPKAVAQEYMCSFEGSGSTVIDGSFIKKIKEEDVRDPIYKSGFGNSMWVWEEPRFGDEYIISADVARGDGEDFSAFHVFKARDLTQVAEFKAKVPIEQYADILMAAASEYNNALLIVENNNLGFLVLRDLERLGYSNLYYSDKSSLLEDAAVSFDAINNERYRMGFLTSQKTRPLIIAKMEEYVRLGNVGLRSSRLLNEMNKFVWKGGRAQARRGSNDDLVMSFAILCWIHSVVYKNIQYQRDMGDVIESAISLSQTRLAISVPGQEAPIYSGGDSRSAGKAYWKSHEDYMWIVKG